MTENSLSNKDCNEHDAQTNHEQPCIQTTEMGTTWTTARRNVQVRGNRTVHAVANEWAENAEDDEQVSESERAVHCDA